MNKLIYILILVLILVVVYNIITKIKKYRNYKSIESFNDLSDDDILSADLETLMNKLEEMKNNYNQLNEDQKITYNKILNRLNEEENNLSNELKELLKKIQETDPLNSFEKPSYNKICKEVDINIDNSVQLRSSPDKDITITCASICKDDPKCLSFQYDSVNKSCKFSKSCHKDTNFIGGKSSNNMIYTKIGGKQPPELNYDIHFNTKLSNYKRFNDDLNLPCSNNKIGETIRNCSRELASKKCDETAGCISWELHKKNRTCNLYSKCHKNMLTKKNFQIFNPPNANRSPNSNAWGRNENQRKAHNRGQLNSPQAWSARSLSKNHSYEIKLSQPTTIDGFVTQGRRDSQQSITKLKVSYFNDDQNERPIGTFRLTAPRQTRADREEYEYVIFNEPVILTKIKFNPIHWINHPSFRVGLLRNINNIKNYEVGTKKATELLPIQRKPRNQHIPLQYGEKVYIYNGNKFYLNEYRNGWFSKKRFKNISIMKIYKAHHNRRRWGIAGRGTINYGDTIFIEAQQTRRKLQRKGRRARFRNRNFGPWEKFIIEPGPGSKANRGPIYSGDVVYIRSHKDRKPFRLQNAYNRRNYSLFQNYNKKGWERMVIQLV